MTTETDPIRLSINTIRMLAVDAVEKANAGHPGMPMGAADYACLLWLKYLRYNPSHPNWPNRDRFVLSAGHGSMLLYALLHLSGYDLPLDEIKNFRQWGSRTPGHPEYGRTPGVEATTGPLGQGFADGVGMAIAAKMMAQRFNRPDFAPVDHHVYAIVSDGDLMEGISSEAASLAGHLKLGNLIYIYDDNQISIDGETKITFTEDVAKRFEGYGWHTERIDGHNHAQIQKAIENARAETARPSLVLARTHIAHGAPSKQDSSESHGAPLGAAEVKATKEALGWPLEPKFLVPDSVRKLFADRAATLEKEFRAWSDGLARWRKNHSDLSTLWDQHWERSVPKDLFTNLCSNPPKMPNATRSISGELQQRVAQAVPSLIGGSADLETSTKTRILGAPSIQPENFAGRNIAFGVREHAMGGILNGCALYGSFIPLGSTFLIFSDYMRPAIRVAALSRLQVIFVFTHDSVFLGEDGPTHQPIEHLASLRLIPNLTLVRPADPLECAAAWQIALSRKNGPTAICLTRQKVPAIERDASVSTQDILKGGYVATEAKKGSPDAVLLATGSELHLALAARKELLTQGIDVRVVSMPCVELFAQQSDGYREKVLPKDIPAAVVEASRGDLWYKWIGVRGLVIGIDHFGESAPDHVLAEKFGFTTSNVTKQVSEWLRNRSA